jgi:hypothetical protein
MAKKKADLVLPVAFGNVNIGDKTARIALKIDRGNLTIAKADTCFTDKRLDCLIKARPNGDAPGQTALPGTETVCELRGVADVKGLRAGGKSFGIGLTFSLAMIPVETLTHFVKKEGDLHVFDVAEIPAEEMEDEDD